MLARYSYGELSTQRSETLQQNPSIIEGKRKKGGRKMATRDPKKSVVEITWAELSETLSKAQLLAPFEDIANITLAHPKMVLIRTKKANKGE